MHMENTICALTHWHFGFEIIAKSTGRRRDRCGAVAFLSPPKWIPMAVAGDRCARRFRLIWDTFWTIAAQSKVTQQC